MDKLINYCCLAAWGLGGVKWAGGILLSFLYPLSRRTGSPWANDHT